MMRILIAEDNEAFRLLLCVALHGHEVFVAKDGAEAITYAECYQPDIILMDVMMPNVSGFTALKKLKRKESTASISVILMSAGYIQQEHIELGLAMGAEDYWKKPFSVLDLPKRLEGYIAKKKVRDGPGLRNPDLNRERSF